MTNGRLCALEAKLVGSKVAQRPDAGALPLVEAEPAAAAIVRAARSSRRTVVVSTPSG